jgi:outer membrane protein assembly factor BamB
MNRRNFPIVLKISGLLSLLLILIYGCDKDNEGTPPIPNSKPGDFKVTVLSRNENSSKISWNEPVDPDGDTLQYSVLLGNKIIGSNLRATTFDINNLIKDSIYYGKGIASDPKGDTSSADFILPAFQGYIYTGIIYGGAGYYCFDIASQKRVSTFIPPYMSYAFIPVIAADTIFTVDNENGNLYALNSSTGSMFWKVTFTIPFAENVSTPLAYGNGKLVFTLGPNLYCYRSLDGVFLWKSQISTSPTQSNPIIVDNTIYVGANDGFLYAFDATSGVKKWEFYSGDAGFVSSPSAANNTVVFISRERLFALDAKTGARRWVYLAADRQNRARIVDGVVYSSIQDGYSYAFDAISGSVI